MITEELIQSTRPAAFVAADISEAYRRRATRFLHTNFTKHGSTLRFVAQIEDSAAHKMDSPLAAEGSLLKAGTEISKKLSDAAIPLTTQNDQAVEALGRGDPEAAVRTDPDFGSAWTALTQKLITSGRKEESTKAAETALARSTLRGDWQKAQLRYALFNNRGDNANALVALNQMAQLAPSDTRILLALAETEIKNRDMDKAVGHLRAALATDPENASALNTLGYAEAIAGRLDAAKAALETYAKLPSNDVNALDSLGEVHFMNGKFKESAAYFHQAYSRDPSFLGGSTLRKAAFAEWLAGNLAGADATLTPYLTALAKKGDGSEIIAQAKWWFSTGRQDQAIAKLGTVPAAQAENAKRQLAVWKGLLNPPSDEATLKKAYESVPPTNDGMVRVFYASALANAGKKTEAAELLKRWPLPDDGDPLLQSLVFTRFQQLRQALGVH